MTNLEEIKKEELSEIKAGYVSPSAIAIDNDGGCADGNGNSGPDGCVDGNGNEG